MCFHLTSASQTEISRGAFPFHFEHTVGCQRSRQGRMTRPFYRVTAGLELLSDRADGSPAVVTRCGFHGIYECFSESICFSIFGFWRDGRSGSRRDVVRVAEMDLAILVKT